MQSKTELNHYEVLGLPKNGKEANGSLVTKEKILKAFREKALTAHPDHGGSEQAFELIKRAKETLTDPVLKAEFDKRLAEDPDQFTISKHLFIDTRSTEHQLSHAPLTNVQLATSTDLVVSESTQLNLSEIILNANYSATELLALMEKNTRLAEGVFQVSALWNLFNKAEKLRSLLTYYENIRKTNTQALETIKQIPALKLLLEQVPIFKDIQLELVSLANETNYTQPLAALLQEYPAALSSIPLNFKLTLITHYPFAVDAILTQHATQLRLTEVLDLLKKCPAQNEKIKSALTPELQQKMGCYEAAKAESKGVVSYLMDNPKSLILLRFEALTIFSKELAAKDQYKISIELLNLLKEDILNKRVRQDDLDVFLNIINFYLHNTTEPIDDFYQNPGVKAFLSQLCFPDFKAFLSNIDTKKITHEETLNYLANYIFTHGEEPEKLEHKSEHTSENPEKYFYHLLKKLEEPIFKFFKKNPKLLIKLIESEDGCRFFKENPTCLDFIVLISAKEEDCASLLKLLISKGFEDIKALQIIKAKEEFKPFLRKKREDKCAAIDMATFEKLYKITGFYSDLVYLNTEEISVNLTLLSEISKNDLNRYAHGHAYEDTYLKSPYNDKLASIFKDRMLQKTELEQVRKIFIWDEAANSLRAIMVDNERYPSMILENLIQNTEVAEKTLTGGFISKLIDSALDNINIIKKNIPALARFDSARADQSAPWTQHDLIKVAKDVDCSEFVITPNNQMFFMEALAFFRSLQNEWLKARLSAYSNLKALLNQLHNDNSTDTRETNESMLKNLTNLLIASGLDADTLTEIYNKLERRPIILNAIFDAIEQGSIPGCNDRIKTKIALFRMKLAPTQKTEHVFKSAAESHIRKMSAKSTQISGNELLDLYEKFGDEILPVIRERGLENILINAKKAKRVLTKLDSKNKSAKIFSKEFTAKDAFDKALEEFASLLVAKPDAKQNDNTSKEFKAQLARQAERYKTPELENLRISCSLEGNPLIWAMHYTMAGNNQLRDQVRAEFSEAAQKYPQAFSSLCFYIHTNLLTATFEIEELYKTVDVHAFQKMFNLWIASEDGEVLCQPYQVWVKKTLSNSDGLEILAENLGNATRNLLMNKLMFSGVVTIARLHDLFGEANTLPLLPILWPQGNPPDEFLTWVNTKLNNSQIDLQQLEIDHNDQFNWIITRLPQKGLYSGQLFNWTSRYVREEKNGLAKLSEKMGIQGRDELLRNFMFSGAVTIDRLQELFGEDNTLPLLPILWPQGNPPDEFLAWVHTKLNNSQIDLQQLKIDHNDQFNWIIARLAEKGFFSDQLFNWASKCVREEKNGLAKLSEKMGIQGRDGLLRNFMFSGAVTIDRLQELFGEDNTLPLLPILWPQGNPPDEFLAWVHTKLNNSQIDLQQLERNHNDQFTWIVTRLVEKDYFSDQLFNWSSRCIREEKSALAILSKKIGDKNRDKLLRASLQGDNKLLRLQTLFGDETNLLPIISLLWNDGNAQSMPGSVVLYLLDAHAHNYDTLQACPQIPPSAKKFIAENKIGSIRSAINQDLLTFEDLTTMSDLELQSYMKLGDVLNLEKKQALDNFFQSAYYAYIKDNVFSNIDAEIVRLKADKGSWGKESGLDKSQHLQNERDKLTWNMAIDIAAMVKGTHNLNTVHDRLLKRVKQLSEQDKLDECRAPIATFFTTLFGFLLALPLALTPILFPGYRDIFFTTTTKKNITHVGEDLRKNPPKYKT